jgi:DnaJ-class molecular chaperone
MDVTCWWCEGTGHRPDPTEEEARDEYLRLCPTCDGEGSISVELDEEDTVEE